MHIILIGGGSASGKTTFAHALSQKLPDAGLVSQDSFYRCKTERLQTEAEPLDFDIPDAVDFGALAAALTRLRGGVVASVPVYDFKSSTRLGTAEIAPDVQTLVVEGTLVLGDAACRRLADLSVFIDADEPLRRARRERRDVAERGFALAAVRQQLADQVFPAHERYVAPTARHADISLDATRLEADFEGALDLVIGLYTSRVGATPILSPHHRDERSWT